MARFIAGLSVCIIITFAATLSATTLSGTFAYDGQPMGTVVSGYDYGQVWAYNQGTGWIFGSVDLGAGTYEITGVPDGDWTIRLLIGQEDFAGRLLWEGTEFLGAAYATVAGEPGITVDLPLFYAYRITMPFEDFWPGPIGSCPYGPETDAEFTFSWDPVPRAVTYDVIVERSSCAGLLDSEVIPTGDTSVQITQTTVQGEEFLTLRVDAWSEGQVQLGVRPHLQYQDGMANGAYLQRGAGGGGREPHPSSSVFVPQVARLPGVAPSYWTSDVILTNPENLELTARLIYTERGANGLQDYFEESILVPAGGCRVIADVVGEMQGAESAGWLEVSPATVRVASRISTPGPAGGSYGQGFPALTLSDAVSLTGQVTSIGAGGVVRGAFRSNLVLTEVWGESATVRVRVLDRLGTVLGARDEVLVPFGTRQLNDVVGKVGGPTTLEEGQVTVEVVAGGGRVVSVLSLVDQDTSDPTTLLLEPR